MVNLSEASIHVQTIYIPKASRPSNCRRRIARKFFSAYYKKDAWSVAGRPSGGWEKREKKRNSGMTDAKGKTGGGLYSLQIND